MTLWSLAQRTGCSRDEALAAVATRAVLRTHALRVTWHFLTRADLARVQVATADRVHKVLRPMLRANGVDDAMLSAWRSFLETELTKGPMTRAEIAARQEGTHFDFAGMTLGLVMMWAELEQVVASGVPAGLTHTYDLVEEVAQPDQRESVAWLVRQFLTSHGPSSVRDLCSWSSLTVTAVRRALADLGDSVESAEILGEIRYWVGNLASGGWPERPTVALLNGYDEYIAGLDARSKVLLDPGRLYRGRPGTPVAVILVDGTLAGHWRRTRSAKSVKLEVTQLRPFTQDELAGLEGEVQRYATFAGLDAELDVLPVAP